MILSKIILVDCIRENIIVFLTKHCQLLQCFFSWVFFLLKLSLSIFFNIKLVENLTLYFFLLFINRKAKSCVKSTVDCYKSCCSFSKFFLSPTHFFFLSWNISSIISLVFIIYLVLIHNYNKIKYIYFIKPY
jgi:hypothetical protein